MVAALENSKQIQSLIAQMTAFDVQLWNTMKSWSGHVYTLLYTMLNPTLITLHLCSSVIRSKPMVR